MRDPRNEREAHATMKNYQTPRTLAEVGMRAADLRTSSEPWTARLLLWAVVIVSCIGIGVMLAWRG